MLGLVAEQPCLAVAGRLDVSTRGGGLVATPSPSQRPSQTFC
jgi:hypothetical protein